MTKKIEIIYDEAVEVCDLPVKFFYNSKGEIFAIRHQLINNPELVSIDMIATATWLGDAQDIVRQLNSQKERYEIEIANNKLLTERLEQRNKQIGKNQTTITQLRNEIENLGADK